MRTLASIAPHLIAEVSSALISEGRGELVLQLESGIIERCTYDESVDAGFVYFVRPAPSPHFAKLAAPVAETISFLSVGFNIDVDHDGHIFGIEFLDRTDFFAALRSENVL
jgi:uncharacterized protein YuzE